MLLYVHKDHKDYKGRGAQDGHPDFTQFLSSESSGGRSVVQTPRNVSMLSRVL